LACRSADRSLKRITDDCGRPLTRHVALSFASSRLPIRPPHREWNEASDPQRDHCGRCRPSICARQRYPSYAVCRRQLQLVGHARQVRQGRGPHLAYYPATMNFYRDFAYARSAAICLFSRPVATNAMTSRSRGDNFRNELSALPWLVPARDALDRGHDRAESLQASPALGMALSGIRSRHPSRLHRHWNVTMSGYEDDRQLSLGTCQFALQFESALAGKPHVKHQAGGSFWRTRREKFAHRTV